MIWAAGAVHDSSASIHRNDDAPTNLFWRKCPSVHPGIAIDYSCDHFGVGRDDVGMAAQELEGGNWTAYVARDGDTVHRSRGPNAAGAAAILTTLERLEYPFAPRYQGRDEEGNDMLTFVPGVTTSHPAERAEESYAVGARMLRALHDLTAGH